jgi:hypothetical protein
MTATINASTSSGIVQTADTSGDLALQSNGTTKLTVSSTGAYGQVVSGTTQATTSGSNIDFTSIPSWVKRITIMFNGVSTSGTNTVIIQLGNGSFVTSGYASIASGFSSSAATTVNYTAGIATGDSSSAAMTRYGNVYLTTLGSNVWTATGSFALPSIGQHVFSGGLTLLGTLDRIRITANADTFDAGSINILYEG